jgi:hypothetical protein
MTETEDAIPRLDGLLKPDHQVLGLALRLLLHRGLADPDRICKAVRDVRNYLGKAGPPNSVALTMVEDLSRDLFGTHDRRLPALRSQIRQSRRRETRRRYAEMRP